MNTTTENSPTIVIPCRHGYPIVTGQELATLQKELALNYKRDATFAPRIVHAIQCGLIEGLHYRTCVYGHISGGNNNNEAYDLAREIRQELSPRGEESYTLEILAIRCKPGDTHLEGNAIPELSLLMQLLTPYLPAQEAV